MTHKPSIAVLGGGLAGLSTLWHLQQAGAANSCLFEKETRVGGLTRSESINGFTFDYTGHLLHFKNEAVGQLVSTLLQGNLHALVRNSWIFSKGVHTRYPFQTNLYGLPLDVVKECILGFIGAPSNQPNGSGRAPTSTRDFPSFAAWIESTLGPGFSRHFMTPYNEKLWTVPLDELTCEWMGRFVPSTSLEQILDGALTDQAKNVGYNATFSYPLRGGIESLPRAFAASLENIHVEWEVKSLDLGKRKIHFANGETFPYDFLVSTMPLNGLLRAATDLPGAVAKAASQLRFTSVYNINLGVNRVLSDKHWIYFPEPEYCFYRAGFPNNFSPNQSPQGCGSIYVELAHSPRKPLDKEAISERVQADLRKAGILRSDDQIVAELQLDIPCAYVIYDQNYRKAVTFLRQFLLEQRIYTIGRYGAWEYSGMEDAIWQGKVAAEEILQV